MSTNTIILEFIYEKLSLMHNQSWQNISHVVWCIDCPRIPIQWSYSEYVGVHLETQTFCCFFRLPFSLLYWNFLTEFILKWRDTRRFHSVFSTLLQGVSPHKILTIIFFFYAIFIRSCLENIRKTTWWVIAKIVIVIAADDLYNSNLPLRMLYH